MESDLTEIVPEERDRILRLMQLFQCSDIPLSSHTKDYSGGEKLRVSLVRAFHLGEVVVINTNLQSLDPTMQTTVKRNIQKLAKREFSQLGTDYTVFIRDNLDIADARIELEASQQDITVLFRENRVQPAGG